MIWTNVLASEVKHVSGISSFDKLDRGYDYKLLPLMVITLKQKLLVDLHGTKFIEMQSLTKSHSSYENHFRKCIKDVLMPKLLKSTDGAEMKLLNRYMKAYIEGIDSVTDFMRIFNKLNLSTPTSITRRGRNFGILDVGLLHQRLRVKTLPVTEASVKKILDDPKYKVAQYKTTFNTRIKTTDQKVAEIEASMNKQFANTTKNDWVDAAQTISKKTVLEGSYAD